MKAVRCHGPHDYRLETIPTPTPGEGELLVKVLAVGICAGDAKCFHGAKHFWANGLVGSYCLTPITPGHEFVGEIAVLGAGMEGKGLKVGDRVLSEQIIPCECCRYCKSGDYNLCIPHDIYGFRKNGAMAEYMIFPKNSLTHVVPPSVPTSHAVFAEPLACALHAVNRSGMGLNDVVVVSGCGAVGCGIVAGARMRNPKCLIAIDLHDWKLELAKESGADVLLNAKDPDLIAKVKELSGGFGCDVYIEATGHPASVTQGLEMIRSKGTFVEYSVFGEKTTCDWTIISDAKELEVKGGHLSPGTFPTAIRLLAEKRLPVDKIITHRLPLENFEKGIQMVANSGESCKVVLTVS
eukprot:GGOE01013957.1.p1 GENE.GGOE01013957.1~~GGOE01013957.1.p1  ORF type:complete len:369 (-),score=98.97 GGOE01013957.1:302-1357(-)